MAPPGAVPAMLPDQSVALLKLENDGASSPECCTFSRLSILSLATVRAL